MRISGGGLWIALQAERERRALGSALKHALRVNFTGGSVPQPGLRVAQAELRLHLLPAAHFILDKVDLRTARGPVDEGWFGIRRFAGAAEVGTHAAGIERLAQGIAADDAALALAHLPDGIAFTASPHLCGQAFDGAVAVGESGVSGGAGGSAPSDGCAAAHRFFDPPEHRRVDVVAIRRHQHLVADAFGQKQGAIADREAAGGRMMCFTERGICFPCSECNPKYIWGGPRPGLGGSAGWKRRAGLGLFS